MAAAESELSQERSQWQAERERLDTELASAQRATAEARETADLTRRQLESEKTLLVAARNAVAEERSRMNELRESMDVHFADSAEERRRAEALRAELDTLRVELEETRVRLVDETRRRSEAEQGRRLADEARSRQSLQDGFVDVTDPRFTRLLDRQWDLWLSGNSDT